MKLVLAVDSSTTSTKVIAFDLEGRLVAQSRHDYPRSNPKPGWQEQDPHDWWTALKAGLADVAAQTAGNELLSLCITHQRETFVLLDENDEPVRPAILWLDTRAGEQIQRYGSGQLHAITGKPASTTPSLFKMLWLAEKEPEAFLAAHRIAEVHAYLVHKLTGDWVTSWATTDPMTVLDMRDFTYSDNVLSLLRVRESLFPELAAPGSVIGQVKDDLANELGLPRGLPVVAGAGDGQCAGLGANVTGTDRAYLSLGTSMTMGVHSDDYLYSMAFRTLSSPIAGAYTLEALLSSGALCISWFANKLSGMSKADGPIEPRLEAMAAEVPAGSRGVHFLPYLTSAETPFWDADARGCFVGVSDTDGVPELYRAVLEGLALEERLSLKKLQKATGVRVERLSVMGGASNSPLFTQIIADALNRPLDICAEAETTCLGAAMLGAAGVGADGEDDVRKWAGRMSHVSHTVEPSDDREVYDLGYKVHRKLYPALRDTFPMIAQIRER
ncbi:MAG: xylulose kinase [Propionibacteriaceae bacterium]|jgi:xylulokinase|nr:xylulose kinase [Propionibacteriaceae bacterium]